MTNRRILPKVAYSLDDAAKYISLNHQIDISVRDLLEYIQNGQLKASVYLSGDKENINTINRKEVDFIKNSKEYRELQLCYSEASIYFRFNPQKFEIEEYEDYSWLHKKDKLFDFYICLPKQRYDINVLKRTEYLNVYDGNVKNIEAVSFEGYFQISQAELNLYNVSSLIDKDFLDSFPKSIVAYYKDVKCFLNIDENTTPLYLDDVCILHEHLISFLELFSVIDSTYDKIEEIQKLTQQLDDKAKEAQKLTQSLEEKEIEIAKLKSTIDKGNYPILLNEFMSDDRLALAIQVRIKHWSKYNPELNNAPKANAITMELREKYNLSQKQAEAIEITACPINRNLLNS